MVDYNFTLQTAVTKTATFQGTGFDLKTGTPRQGFTARFLISSLISAATAGTVFTPSIEHSDDNTTFSTLAAAPPITGTTTAQSFEPFIVFSTPKRYVRAVMTLSSAAGTPSVTYKVEPKLTWP
jgi:hypothetical protein